MHEVANLILWIVVGLGWLAVWRVGLHVFRIVPLGDWPRRREGLKRLGKAKYVLVCGVFGAGFAFALVMITDDFLSQRAHGLVSELAKFILMALFFGVAMGLSNWPTVRGPVPFPPDYGSPK